MKKKSISQSSHVRCNFARTLGSAGGFCNSRASTGLFASLAGVLVALFAFGASTAPLQAEGPGHQPNKPSDFVKIVSPVSPEASGTWTVTGSLNAARFEDSATFLL